MAEQKSRIYSLPEITEINDDMYLMLDASDTGARRFNLKTFYDKVDGVQASADAANTAATAAAAAVDSANQAAQQAASAAASATTTVQGLVDDVNEAIEAVGDVTELAVPTMSTTVKGGAKLGTGLEVTGDTLSVNTSASGDGSQAGPILSLSAKGWAEQDSTTGKNLCPRFTSMSDSNIAFTVNADGSITVSGTAVGDNKQIERQGIYLPAGVYTISGCPSGGGFGTYDIFPWDVTTSARPKNESGGVASSDFGSGATFVVVEGHETKIVIRVANGYTINNLTFYPQLELGSTATEYEPYSGGAPSPSPSFPQEIRVCRGRNLAITAVYKQGYIIDTSGVETSASGFFISEMFKVEPSTKYSVTFRQVGQLNDAVRVVWYDANGAFILRNTVITTASGIVTSPSNAANARVSYCNVPTNSSYIDHVQLERGSVATPYVPYGYVGLEVQGKNLASKYIASGFTASGLTVSFTNKGEMLVNGTATSNTALDTKAFSLGVLPSGKFVVSIRLLSGTISDATNVNVRVGSGVNSSYVVSVRMSNGVAKYVINADGSTQYWATVGVIVSGVVFTNALFGIQAEVGETPTPYEPYYRTTTPIPLPSRGWAASLPDGTADTLTLDGAGKVTWERNVSEFKISDLSYTYEGTSKRFSAPTSSLGIAKHSAHRNTPMIAESFVVKCNNESYDGSWDGVAYINSDSTFWVHARAYTTVADMLAALGDTTVLYPLATPVTEEMGYVEMPDIPVGVEISIPELDDLGVKYCVDDAASELARMWYGKAKSEYAEELAELRMTVSELATRIS